MATKKKNRYEEDRVYLPLEIYDDEETTLLLKRNFERQNEPKADFVMPEPGTDEQITVLANEIPVGEIPKQYQSRFDNNFDNCRKAYVSIDETEEGSGEYIARAVLVVNREITDEDLKNARRNMNLTMGITILCIVILGVLMFVRGYILDGVICVIALLFLIYMVFIRKIIKSSSFYRKK